MIISDLILQIIKNCFATCWQLLQKQSLEKTVSLSFHPDKILPRKHGREAIK